MQLRCGTEGDKSARLYLYRPINLYPLSLSLLTLPPSSLLSPSLSVTVVNPALVLTHALPLFLSPSLQFYASGITPVSLPPLTPSAGVKYHSSEDNDHPFFYLFHASFVCFYVSPHTDLEQLSALMMATEVWGDF